MTMTTVIPLGKRGRAVAADNAATQEVIWPVHELPDGAACGQWLHEVVAGTDYEGTALSLWTHHQNLRDATEKLASFITPRWPSASGGSLLQNAVNEAVTRAHEAIDQGQAFQGRLVGVYLYGLMTVVQDIAGLVIRGKGASGNVHRWEYFSQPLLEWARQHNIEQVLVSKVRERPSAAMVEGLRTHLLARIADPIDAGYLAKHAPHG